MSFKIDGIIIDRVQMAIAETTGTHEFLYTLTQLSDPQIEISAESKDAKDANGTLIKRFYNAKSGTFTANNAFIDFNILGATTGSGKMVADKVDGGIKMPKILFINAADATAPIDLPDLKASASTAETLKVASVAGNGTMLTAYKLGTGFQYDKTTGKLTLPTLSEEDKAAGATKFVVMYDRMVTTGGVAVKNRADKFPSTIRLTLKCLCVDPCDAGTLRAAYIVLPSFQVSPETTVEMKTESQLAYKGQLQVDYCSDDKTLYEIYMAQDDVEA